MRRSWRWLPVLAVGGVLEVACSLMFDLSDYASMGPDGLDASGGDASNESAIGPRLEAVDGSTCSDQDFTQDPKHCGRCGHDCAGGQCLDSRCLPAVLMVGLGHVVGVAVVGDFVYVGSNDGITRVGLDGAGATEVVGNVSPHYITASPTHLYWADGSGAVMRWPLAGGSKETLVPKVARIEGVAVDPNYVYFTRYQDAGAVERALLDGGARESILAPYFFPEDVESVDGELIVGGDGVNELAVYADGGFGQKRVLSRGSAPVAMAVSGPDVFFVQQADNTIRRVAFSGGSPELVASARGKPCGIAATTSSVFWVTCSGGELLRLVR